MTKITVTYEIPEQLMRDIIITACEGGIGYWSQLETYDGHGIDASVEGALPLRIRVIEEERPDGCEYGKWMNLGIPEVAKGLRLMFQEYPDRLDTHRMIEAVANYDSGNYDFDADDADNVIQFALFGELVYG